MNYPRQWISTKKPEIKIIDDSDDEADELTDAATLTQKHLPPIKKKKK